MFSNVYIEPTSLASSLKIYYPDGEDMNTSKTSSIIRKNNLAQRKADVVNELNETYTEEMDDESSQYYDPNNDSGELLLFTCLDLQAINDEFDKGDYHGESRANQAKNVTILHYPSHN